MSAPTPQLAILANGVRLVCIPLPHLASASVSVFVRAGSAHEAARFNGIGHAVEHMVFKGTQARDRRRINLDAERLGADVNAHTDKDHTAFHLRGLAEHVERYVHMLGDLVCRPTFPQEEIEPERQVLLAEFAEDEDDALATAFKLFDKACWGLHPFAQPVIGRRRTLEQFTRRDLVEHVQHLYTGANVIVAAAGPFGPGQAAGTPEALLRAVEQAFGALQAGSPNLVPPVRWSGGLASRHLAGTSQAHAVLGFPIPDLAADDAAFPLAAATLGEGMSSPLMERLREELGLAYYAACSADVYDGFGQFVIEASMAPDRLDECLRESVTLLCRHAEQVEADDVERARSQLLVRQLRHQESPTRLLEAMALDLFALGRVRSAHERAERLRSVGPPEVRQAFVRMLGSGTSVAVSGAVGRGVRERLRQLVAPLGQGLFARRG